MFGALWNCDELCSAEDRNFCSLFWMLFMQHFADIDENVINRQQQG